jgi:hypothetical protein
MKYEIGDIITQTALGVARSYTLVRTTPHTNRYGKPSLVLWWSGRCKTCGCAFETSSSRTCRELTRNCRAHVMRTGRAAA